MLYKIFYALCILCITLPSIAAHRTGDPLFHFATKEPDFSGCEEIVLGPRESLIYAFHAEHEDTALFLNNHLKDAIQTYAHEPVVITHKLCSIMQKTLKSFLQQQEDPFNLALQQVVITFFHPQRNNVSVHHIACDQGTFKQIDTIEYKNICNDPRRLFISLLTHNEAPNELLLDSLHQIEYNALTKAAAAKAPEKLLTALLEKDNNIKGLVALSGYRWLKRTYPTFITREYQQLSKKFHAKQQGKLYRLVTPLEKSILLHAQDTREQLLTFAAQLRMNSKNPIPQFALDFLDDTIEEKREQEEHEQQTNRLLCFINLVPS